MESSSLNNLRVINEKIELINVYHFIKLHRNQNFWIKSSTFAIYHLLAIVFSMQHSKQRYNAITDYKTDMTEMKISCYLKDFYWFIDTLAKQHFKFIWSYSTIFNSFSHFANTVPFSRGPWLENCEFHRLFFSSR